VARFEQPIVAVKHVKQPDSDEPNSDTEKKAKNTKRHRLSPANF
jgi:hypothetical protein